MKNKTSDGAGGRAINTGDIVEFCGLLVLALALPCLVWGFGDSLELVARAVEGVVLYACGVYMKGKGAK